MYRLLKRIRIRYLALVLTFLPISASALPSFNNLFVFGDSLSDTGNVFLATGEVQCVPFNCESDPDLVPGAAYSTPNLDSPLPPPIPPFPRFSNGPVWVEVLASGLGLSADPSLAGGTNFSFGGARTGPAFSIPPSLLDQFFGLFLTSTGGVIPADSLYVVWGGGDDGRDIAKAKVDPNNPITDSEASMLIADAVDNVAQIVGTLAATGASVVIPNLPDLAVTPEARDRDTQGDLEGLGPASTMVSEEFNAILETVLASLATAFPMADIIEVDVFSLVNDVVSDPAAFGFTDAINPCISFDTVCLNPNEFVFLDGIHPTTAGHAVIAQAALAAVPESSTIMLMSLGFAGLAFARRRRRLTA